MTSTLTTKAIAVAIIALCANLLAIDVLSQGRRGGGGGRAGAGFSRSGPAASGSFSARQAGPQLSGQRAGRYQGGGATQGAAQERAGQRQQAASERQTQRQQSQSQRQQGAAEKQEERQGYRSETQQQRQDYASEAQERRQDYAEEAREDWQDYDDDWDDWDNSGALVAGAAVAAGAYAVGRATATPSTTYIVQAPCSPMTEVSANGITYYGCGSSWYTRSYAGGDIVYITSAPPPRP